jgi:hypothetical protein
MTLPLFNVSADSRPLRQRERQRPYHYLVTRRHCDYDDRGEETDVEYDLGGHDDEYRARDDMYDGDGLLDNWSGAWVVEPAWSGEVDVAVEGFARYDLRPTAAK